MERKAKLKLAIQAIDYRRVQLSNLLYASDCVLCQAHFGCEECPAFRTNKLAFSCQDFARAIADMDVALLTQRMDFQRELESLIRREG
jgi:hypothetical protein